MTTRTFPALDALTRRWLDNPATAPCDCGVGCACIRHGSAVVCCECGEVTPEAETRDGVCDDCRALDREADEAEGVTGLQVRLLAAL